MRPMPDRGVAGADPRVPSRSQALRRGLPCTPPAAPAAPLPDPAPGTATFAAEVLAGLRHPRKTLPSKLLYDPIGAALFDRICELPEYYLTRTELAILRRHAPDIAATLGPNCLIVEYGCGSGTKTRLLLDHLAAPAGYVPIDIARGHLLATARTLAAAYPGLPVTPVCADYTSDFALPAALAAPARTVAFFPGSTIGNFAPPQARAFLRALRRRHGPGTGLLIGVDLKKDPRLLHAAYNDAAGVTAAFNLNLLARINRELHADIALERFAHYAFYHARRGRIEMHLVSLADQPWRIAGERIVFAAGESIFTESSYKYTVAEFAQLAAAAGYEVQRLWTDEAGLFSVHYLLSR